jgi:hypothetical protein
MFYCHLFVFWALLACKYSKDGRQYYIERDEVKPAIDVVKNLAAALDTTV